MKTPVEVPRREKVLFTAAGVTKGDLADYYARIADRMLPYLEGRPLVMERFPDGIDGHGFFHKEVPQHFPEWIPRVTVPKEAGGSTTYVVVNDAETLVYLAGQAMVTPHIWLTRADAPRRPDQMVIDLDPGDDRALVPLAARAVKEVLDELELPAFAKSSGSKGIHIHVPLDAADEIDAVRAFAFGVAQVLAARNGETMTVEPRKAARKGRLYLDVARNGYAQHAVAPYAVRAVPEASVAVPIDWREATSGGFDARAFTIKNVFRRVGRKADPWEGFASATGGSLDESAPRLMELLRKAA